ASAKQGYPVVSRVLARIAPISTQPVFRIFTEIGQQLRATVHKVERLTSNIIEVVVHAPLAARHFHPGQFYRFQNFASLAKLSEQTRLAMEGIALTGASVDI